MTIKEILEAKNITSNSLKKPIAHYDFTVTNSIYDAIDVYDIAYIQGDMYLIYKPVCNCTDKVQKFRVAVRKEDNCLNVIDSNGKHHNVSINQIYRY